MTALRVCLFVLVVLFAAAAHSSQQNEDGKRVLVLLEGNHIKDTHSMFFDFLKGKGFSLKFALADSPSLALRKYGERLFDHLIVFAPSVEEFGGSVSPNAIAQFIDHGGNVLVAADRTLGEPIRDIATEAGFELDEEGTSVIDFINNEAGDNTLVKANGFVNAPIIVKPTSKPVLFRGVAMVQDSSNPLTIPVLTGSSTCYSFKPDADVSEFPFAVGKNAVLVGALQARNNARVVLSGSIDLFSNELLINSKTGNKEFAESIALWVLKEAGVLRASPALHHLAGEATPRTEYTVSQDVDYSLSIEEKKDGKWVPYAGKDVQLEFVRIDPFVRRTLQNTNGKMHTTFTLPDVYGIFKFRVEYCRLGYTCVESENQVSVRPLRHTQYERFLESAYPYYAGAFSMMFGLFVFSFVFLYHQEKPAAK